jgi:phosphoribosylanthranilate isomerase
VALMVDADDAALDALLEGFRPDLLQLHGKETPERVAAVRARTGLPVMKAIGVGEAADLEAAKPYETVADRLLFDAKPPKRDGALPGGNAVSFDWTLLAGRRWARPWMLSGGLAPGNVAAAIRISGAAAVDVSSGVEDRPGHKSPRLIRRFLAAVRAA